MNTPQEAIEELEFTVKTLGLKVINIPGGVKRPIKAIADKYPADKFPRIVASLREADLYFQSATPNHEHDPLSQIKT